MSRDNFLTMAQAMATINAGACRMCVIANNERDKLKNELANHKQANHVVLELIKKINSSEVWWEGCEEFVEKYSIT